MTRRFPLAAVLALLLVVPSTVPAQNPPFPYPLPNPVVKPGLTVQVAPKRDRTKPYRFSVSGRLDPGSAGAAACNGRIRIRGKVLATTLIREVTQVTSTCTYAAQVQLPKRAGASGRVGFRVRFERTVLLMPVSKGNPGYFGQAKPKK